MKKISSILTIFPLLDVLPDHFQILITYPALLILSTVLCIALALVYRINIIKPLEKRLEELTAERSQAKLVAEAANQAKSQLIANLSPELKTSLNTILASAQILQRDPNLNSKQKESVDVIYNCGFNLLLLIDEKLDISKSKVDQIEIDAIFDDKNIIGFSGDKCKILVVDDASENRLVLKNLLELWGFTVEEANNGQEGLEKIKAFQPDLVITDLIMPILDGLEMVKQLRLSPEYHDLPVIAASGSASNQDQKLALENGCSDWIPKPIQVDELLQKLQTYLQLIWIYAEEDIVEK
ncbi:MAG: response regulator [Limnoraphis robusta]